MMDLPRHWAKSAEAGGLWLRLRRARRSILMLDYDGTLAPFKQNRMEAYPYRGVEERLAVLAKLPNVRLALISGRAAGELKELLEIRCGWETRFEIWGNHGQEHLDASGSYRLFPLRPGEAETLQQVQERLEQLGFSQTVEAKLASIAIHWRGLGAAEQAEIRSAVESIYAQHTGETTLKLLPFDGGLELRSEFRTKGTAVKQLLAEEGSGVPAAYLGDDRTDEDGFAALNGHGLSFLVSSEPRKSRALFWIRPPDELLGFLDGWIDCSKAEAAKAKTPLSLADVELSTLQPEGDR